MTVTNKRKMQKKIVDYEMFILIWISELCVTPSKRCGLNLITNSVK